jgi:hypothetical protein
MKISLLRLAVEKTSGSNDSKTEQSANDHKEQRHCSCDAIESSFSTTFALKQNRLSAYSTHTLSLRSVEENQNYQHEPENNFGAKQNHISYVHAYSSQKMQRKIITDLPQDQGLSGFLTW